MADPKLITDLLDPPAQKWIRVAHLGGRTPNQREMARFRSLGVAPFDLGSPWPVLADRVVFEGKSFQFASDVGWPGEAAFTLAVIGHDAIIDVVAWQPEGRLALWLGKGFALGERQIFNPNPLSEGLLVHRSPLNWLRAGRSGIVILRDDFTRSILGCVPSLVVEDEDHLEEMQEFFPLGWGPKLISRRPKQPIVVKIHAEVAE